MNIKKIGCGLLVLAFLYGCAGTMAYREGNRLIERGEVQSGLAQLEAAMQADPSNAQFRSAYYAQKEAAVNQALALAQTQFKLNQPELAKAQYQKVLKLDSNNTKAMRGLQQIETAEQVHAMLVPVRQNLDGKNFALAEQLLTRALELQPDNAQGLLLKKELDKAIGLEKNAPARLSDVYRQPVSVAFRDAPLSYVFDVLAHETNINFMFDKDVKTQVPVTLTVKQKSVEDVLRVVVAMNQLSMRVLDSNTVLIHANTPEKAGEYQEMVIRNFYLSHADAKQMASMLKAMVKVKEMFVDERLNLLVIKDTRQVIDLAEKLIATQDIAEPEVMLELEVLEVASNKMRDLGIRWPDQLSASVTGSSGVPGDLTYDEFRNPSRGLVNVQVNNPLVTATLRQLDGDASLLANPRIRVRNKEKANVLIGERVPVVTTTTTANVGTSESVNYLDVGLKLNFEPTISLDQQVSMKVSLEVSNILETITRTSGTQTYRLGTRNTSTVLRVKDGETQILAGLIQQDERNSAQRVPFLGDIPILGRLFSSTSSNGVKTEIVLLITPRIIRNIPMPENGKSEILSGTENAVGASPIQLRSAVPSGLPTAPAVNPAGLVSPMPAPPLSVPTLPMPDPTLGVPGMTLPSLPGQVQ